MGKNSAIEWTHHTFNPWWGCARVSPGCSNCYAEAWAKRVGARVWGRAQERRFFGDAHWNEPLKWNAEANAINERKRVFCASMADVFERRTDLSVWRERLWKLILETPMLDWLLLTKRPQNIDSMAPWESVWPDNVWIGTTVEDQACARERLPHLLKHPAKTRFLSCEPLLGALDLSPWIDSLPKEHFPINWVIAGGESGTNARPMLPGWAMGLRDQCERARIPFHFKQWGHWAPVPSEASNAPGVLKFWDEVLGEVFMEPKGKKEAGRLLGDRYWNGLPKAA
jgi:protein gp37